MFETVRGESFFFFKDQVLVICFMSQSFYYIFLFFSGIRNSDKPQSNDNNLIKCDKQLLSFHILYTSKKIRWGFEVLVYIPYKLFLIQACARALMWVFFLLLVFFQHRPSLLFLATFQQLAKSNTPSSGRWLTITSCF